MAAVDVVRPQSNHFHHRCYNPKPLISSSSKSPSFMRSRSDFSPKSNPNPSFSGSSKPRRKQSSPNKKKSSTSSTATSGGRRYKSNSPRKSENSPLVPGKVKILKRGEALTDITAWSEKENQVNKKDEDQKFGNGGGSLDMVMAKQLFMADLYAGSSVTPPSPSCLPMPGFTMKSSGTLQKRNYNNNDDDATATSGLLRLLNLNL